MYYKGEWVMGSDEIVDSLPRLFPAHPLRKATSIGTVIPAEARADVTGWMEKWVQIDPTLQEPPAMAWCLAGSKYLEALRPLERYFATGEQFLCGDEFGEEDASWFPHISSSFDYLGPLNGFEYEKEVPALAAYCQRVAQLPAIRAVTYPETSRLRVPHFVSKLARNCPFLVYRLSGGFSMPK
jgi:glutathione S-transferase